MNTPLLNARAEKHNVEIKEMYSRVEAMCLMEIGPAWMSKMLKSSKLQDGKWLQSARLENVVTSTGNMRGEWSIPADDIEEYISYQEEKRARAEARRADPIGYYRKARATRSSTTNVERMLELMTPEAREELLQRLQEMQTNGE